MTDSLIDFFGDIKDFGDYNKYYHPFELTADVADDQCNRRDSDLIYIVAIGRRIIAHGMLRGWEEGYKVPSLGIIVHPSYTGQGIGSMFMRFLHLAAWFKGAKAVRLSVYKANTPAVNMYRKFGYEFSDKNDKEYIGILRRPGEE
jgi:ribosomal protein S18 acetylase RimI-like enzyme